MLLGVARQRICRRSAGNGLHLGTVTQIGQSIAQILGNALLRLVEHALDHALILLVIQHAVGHAIKRAIGSHAVHAHVAGRHGMHHGQLGVGIAGNQVLGVVQSVLRVIGPIVGDHDMTEHHNGLLPSKAPGGTPPRRLETGGRSPDAQGLPLGALLSDPTVTLPSFKQVTHRVEPAHDYTPCSAQRAADPRSEPRRKARRTAERGRTHAHTRKRARPETGPRPEKPAFPSVTG